MVSSQNAVLSNPLRDATQATEDTLRGCTANTNATKALAQRDPVIQRRSANSRRTLIACRTRLLM